MQARGSPGGFTLLEVLIAFIIAALALAALFEGGLGGLRAATVSARYMEAVSRAQSHLDAATIGDALVPSDRQGDEGNGFHWRLRITVAAAAPPNAAQKGAPVMALYTISAAESWTEDGHTRALELDTMRDGSAPPPPP